MPTTPVGAQPVKIVDINDPQGVVINRSLTNQVLWGTTASLANRADASIIDPFGSISVDTDAEVWVQCPTGTAIVDYLPHGQGFFRGITSGQGMLVINSIRSANYVPGASGWAIFSNGNVEFNGGTFRGTVVADVTVGGITYAVGLNQLGGSGLPGFSINDVNNPVLGPPGVYGQGSAGASPMASSSLTSGLITNTDIDAHLTMESQVTSAITNGLAQMPVGLFAVGANGTLSVDDNKGVVTLGQNLSATPSAGIHSGFFSDSNNRLRYINATDGNPYTLGRTLTHPLPNQTINSPTFTSVNGSSRSVAQGALYRVTGFVIYHGVSGSGNGALQWSTPGVTRADGYSYWIQGSPNNLGVWLATLSLSNSPSPLSTGLSIWFFDMFINFSAGGNLVLQAAAASGTTWVIDAVDYVLEPV